MKLGLYHDIARLDEAASEAERIAELGFDGIQFSACHRTSPGKPPTWIDLGDQACREVRRNYERHGLEIAALSGYTNLTPPQEQERLDNVASLRRLIRRAPELGARSVVTWSGWRGERLLDPDPSVETAETWETFLRSADEVVGVARDVGVTVVWELYFTHVLGTVERIVGALERWEGRNVGIVIDPPNLVPPAQLDRLEPLVDEQFSALGKYIALAHAKDVRADGDQVAYPEPGAGVLDYGRYVDRLRGAGYSGYVIVEHVTDETVATAAGYVRRFLA
jgi:sugar phosphate isomerase/epimerase